MTGYQRLLGYDIMSPREKQATAKPAFAFQGELTSKCFCEAETKALQERICESNQPRRKASDGKAGICFSGRINEQMFLRSRNESLARADLRV